jgi:hypothetical protein
MIKHPFQQMKYDLKFVRVMTQMILALPDKEWPELDYTAFLAVSQLTDQNKSPTRNEMLAFITWWLTFSKRLIEALPDVEGVDKIRQEWDKVSTEYRYLLEEVTT